MNTIFCLTLHKVSWGITVFRNWVFLIATLSLGSLPVLQNERFDYRGCSVRTMLFVTRVCDLASDILLSDRCLRFSVAQMVQKVDKKNFQQQLYLIWKKESGDIATCLHFIDMSLTPPFSQPKFSTRCCRASSNDKYQLYVKLDVEDNN